MTQTIAGVLGPALRDRPDADLSSLAEAWCGGGNPTPPPTTTPPTTGSCAPAWVSNVAYVSGNEVSCNGANWTANQWNYDEVPGGVNGAWNNDGAC